MVDRTNETLPIPGPKGQFIVGSARQFQADKLGFLKRCAYEYGDFFSFKAGPMRVVVANDLAAIETMLVAEPQRFVKSRVTRDIFGRIMGQGLMVSEGELHRSQRRAVQGGIDAARIQAHTELVTKHVHRALESWPADGTIDMEREMSTISLGVISEALFGPSLGSEENRLLGAMKEFQATGSALFNSGFVPPRWLPTPRNRRLARAVAEIDNVVDSLIERRHDDQSHRDDLLSLLLSSRDDDGRAMRRELVRDEIRTLFSAGYETSANALTWATYFLAANVAVQERLASERSTSYALLVAKETLRACCPVWAFNRSPIERTSLCGFEIQPSDLVIVSPYLLHSDPRHFEHPERFDPERFSPEREQRHPKLAFMPFGAGPRACVGARLALIEIAIVVHAIAERFRVELAPGASVEPEAFLTVRPKAGLKLRVRRAEADSPGA
jgi:cytochrome P450